MSGLIQRKNLNFTWKYTKLIISNLVGFIEWRDKIYRENLIKKQKEIQY